MFFTIANLLALKKFRIRTNDHVKLLNTLHREMGTLRIRLDEGFWVWFVRGAVARGDEEGSDSG